MKRRHPFAMLLFAMALSTLTGCAMNSRGENGALLGGLGGAGLGAIAGHQVGHTGAGAAIGALAGAVTGGVIGNEIDEIEARNRAEIAASLGRPVAPGAVSIDDVIEMSQRGVNQNVIAQHVRSQGTQRPLGKDDLIRLSQAGVSDQVIRAMQEQPAPRVVAPAYGPPPPVVVEHYYDPWCWGPPRYYHHHHRHRHGPPGYSIGFSYSN